MVRPPDDDAAPTTPTSIGRARLLTAYAAGGFGLGANAMANFLVPLRAHELGAGFGMIGVVVAAGALMPALFSVPLGILIDRLGSRRAFILGTSSTAIVALLFALAPSPIMLLLLQLCFGLARSLGWIASQSYVTGLGSVDDRSGHTGRFSFFVNLGVVVGPLIVGGVAQLVGFRLAFLVLAAHALLFALVGVFLQELPHQGGDRSKGTGFRSVLSLLAIRGMQVALLLTFARLWIDWVWTAFFPVYAVEAGVAPGLAGTVVTGKALVATLLAPTAGFWAKRLTAEGATAISLGCGTAGLLMTPHLVEIPLVYGSGMLVGIGAGLSLPLLLTIVAQAVPAEQRGLALGLRVNVNQIAATGAPVFAGPLIGALGYMTAFGLSGGVAGTLIACAAILFLRMRDT